MNPSNKTFVLALGSLLGLALAACSGGAASGDDAVAAPSGSASGSANATPPSPPGLPAAQPPDAGPLSPSSPDAGTGVKTDPPVVKHCTVSLVEPDVCIENAQGRAGDVVDVDIVLLGNATCGDAWEANGRVAFDLTKFQVENEVEQIACRTRRIGPDANGTTNLEWNAFGGGSLAGCAANVPLGKVDTITVKIAPGTPPGEYDLTWNDAGFIANASAPPQCTTIGHGIGGKLRVLP